MRSDFRTELTPRPFSIQRRYTKYAAGSVLVATGDTKVICTASVEDRTAPFLRDTGKGWLTAEYSLLPGSTHTRAQREVNKGKPSGRTNEIQRLIGRSLRSVIDFDVLGEKTIYVDCDVLQADGGTRTAAITGAMVAVYDAVQTLIEKKVITESPIQQLLAAISVGVVDGQVLCDLSYDEDSRAEVDMNVVMTEDGRFVEIQGTAENHPFTSDQLNDLLVTARSGIEGLLAQMRLELSRPSE